MTATVLPARPRFTGLNAQKFADAMVSATRFVNAGGQRGPVPEPRAIVGSRPVTVENIVTDVLTWIGLPTSSDDGTGPQTPVSALVQSLWGALVVSARANMAQVYDYFEDVLERKSFDGKGALVSVSIRYKPRNSTAGYANAFWDPNRQLFAFGDAGYLQAGLDIVADEFAPAVTSHVVGGGGPVLDFDVASMSTARSSAMPRCSAAPGAGAGRRSARRHRPRLRHRRDPRCRSVIGRRRLTGRSELRRRGGRRGSAARSVRRAWSAG